MLKEKDAPQNLFFVVDASQNETLYNETMKAMLCDEYSCDKLTKSRRVVKIHHLFKKGYSVDDGKNKIRSLDGELLNSFKRIARAFYFEDFKDSKRFEMRVKFSEVRGVVIF